MDRSRLAIHFAEPRNRNVRFGRWASGNPFTFAMQPGTGRMYINDVGSNFFEEINEALVGDLNPASMRNYGWPLTEGVFDPSAAPRFRNPVLRIRAWGLGRGVCYYRRRLLRRRSSEFPKLLRR
jgi:glucose/arabinose dehydrogenase